MKKHVRHVYIIGSKGIPSKYGGFETFVDKLTENKSNDLIKYHVACMSENSKKSNISGTEFEYNNAHCFNVNIPKIGPAKAVYYDLVALNKAISISKRNKDYKPIFYILACRIGPFISYYKDKINSLDGILMVNPDGHEWLRQKWSYVVRKYWKYSERFMVKYADLLICDSLEIEKYIKRDYNSYKPKTEYISYGTELNLSVYNKTSIEVYDWLKKFKIIENEYYLIVGRFVPENNYESIIRGFLSSSTKKDLVIITNVTQNKFYNYLNKKTNFTNDQRVKFVGTVYDKNLLKYIRSSAFAYIHGHAVGGTNPSLLEALASTKVNLLYDVPFNREVGSVGAYYWKNSSSLKTLINIIENYDGEKLEDKDFDMKKYLRKKYSWEVICNQYEKLFAEDLKNS